MTDEEKKEFLDANKLDKKIPQNLLMKYQNNWYILKAGLEWKAMYLYGGGNYGVTTEIIEKNPDYVLARAIFKTKDGVEFSNYGEASKANVSNPQMLRHLLHLAVTRAECRVLRMATACGYTSIEEMDTAQDKVKEIPENPKDGEKPTDSQIATIETLLAKQKDVASLPDEIKTPKTFREANIAINTLLGRKV